ncbi:unnamed protein product [Psylliodes chrysocephalus]|uniref:Uncharacterized protein n=1 Tax=Psylliodes chrysocephalus TaxID=3402493 RepID=A0A9P0GE30_9CUCU|nr:unnamed protein product [Psylliodes chrysocephala]
MTKFVATFLILISVYCLQVAPVTVHQPPEQIAQIKKGTDACEKEIHVNKELILKARKGDFSDDSTLKEYVFCAVQKHKFVVDGKIIKDAIDKQVIIGTGDKDFATETYNKCYQEKDNLVAPITIHSPPEQLEMFRKVIDACLKEIGVKEELVLKARKGDFSEDSTLKEYVFCTAKKYKYVVNGKLDKEAIDREIIIATGDKDLATKTYNKCYQEKDTLVNSIFEMLKCYSKDIPLPVI